MRGTLRFWGEWFGRPYDNIHTFIGCDADGECLRVYFDEGETLSVWSPSRASVDRDTFRIRDVQRVRWEWFYYGRPKAPENLYFEEFVKNGNTIAASTNVDWHTPQLNPDPSQPAVEMF